MSIVNAAFILGLQCISDKRQWWTQKIQSNDKRPVAGWLAVNVSDVRGCAKNTFILFSPN
jgi:hypothetical protein